MTWARWIFRQATIAINAGPFGTDMLPSQCEDSVSHVSSAYPDPKGARVARTITEVTAGAPCCPKRQSCTLPDATFVAETSTWGNERICVGRVARIATPDLRLRPRLESSEQIGIDISALWHVADSATGATAF